MKLEEEDVLGKKNKEEMVWEKWWILMFVVNSVFGFKVGTHRPFLEAISNDVSLVSNQDKHTHIQLN